MFVVPVEAFKPIGEVLRGDVIQLNPELPGVFVHSRELALPSPYNKTALCVSTLDDDPLAFTFAPIVLYDNSHIVYVKEHHF